MSFKKFLSNRKSDRADKLAERAARKERRSAALAAEAAERENRKRFSSFRTQQKAADSQQDKSIMALEKDVDRLEGNSSDRFDSVSSSVKNLSMSISRRQNEIEASALAIEDGIAAEEASASRVAKKMQLAFANAVGGGGMQSLLQKANKDGKLSMTELTAGVSGLANFAIAGFNGLRKEVALNEGAITTLDGQVDALFEVAEGIDGNARAISGISTVGTESGLFDSGDPLNNLANGAFFWRGKRVDVISLFLSWVSIKGCTVYTKFDREDEDLADWFMSDKDPAKVCTGFRIIGADTQAKLESDGAGYQVDPTSGAFTQAVLSAGDTWPLGALVATNQELGLAPNINTVLKAAGSFGIMAAGDRWYTTLIPLFSEKLGSLIGLGEGADLVNSKAS
jgi:hypothetical protein